LLLVELLRLLRLLMLILLRLLRLLLLLLLRSIWHAGKVLDRVGSYGTARFSVLARRRTNARVQTLDCAFCAILARLGRVASFFLADASITSPPATRRTVRQAVACLNMALQDIRPLKGGATQDAAMWAFRGV
jgi:hypothetical protein